jgi:hypothetical protein
MKLLSRFRLDYGLAISAQLCQINKITMRKGIDEATLQQFAFLATFKERLESKETEVVIEVILEDELPLLCLVVGEPTTLQ